MNYPNISIIEGFSSKIIGFVLKILRRLFGNNYVLTSTAIVNHKKQQTLGAYFTQKKGIIRIMTYENLLDLDLVKNEKLFQKYITPKDNIISQIDKRIFERRCIGIHIRRTDNSLAKEKSKLNDFIKIIRKEIAEDESIKFFVASDSEETKKELQNIFGKDKIICYNSLLERNSEKGMEYAMLELCTLSKCKKVYGSYWSSYSEVAALMGDIPLEIIVSNP